MFSAGREESRCEIYKSIHGCAGRPYGIPRAASMSEMYRLGMQSRTGTLIFVCSNCKAAPNFTSGSQDDGDLLVLMFCPK